MTIKKIGRNDPCPCGSGKKYKQCCQQQDEPAPAAAPVAAELSIPNALQTAMTYHQSGRLLQAESIYRQILQAAPNHPDALHLLGLLAKQQGDQKTAIELIGKALAIKPDYVEAHVNLGATLQEQKRLDEAAASYRKALALKPGYAEVHSNLGVVLKEQGQLDEAAACFHRALELKPDFAEVYSNLGVVLKEQGRLDEAIACYGKALTFNPGYSEAHGNLGALLKEQGQLNEAVACYRKALALKPDYAEAYSNLGAALKEQGGLEEAAVAYRKALALKPDFAEAHINLGLVLQEQGRSVEALPHYHKALDIAPSLLAARQGIYTALCRIVPEWHVPMMNEQNRNNAYFSALKSAITPESEIFEIGTGSGLLAMMAAKLGASKVTTCEAEPLIAETAQRIVADNGYGESIKVISKKSVNIEVGEDMPGKADILVSEIFSSELLGEHVLSSIEDAKRRLIKPQARIIPAAGSIMVALFSGDDIRRNLMVEDSFGFNLQHFNSIVSKKRMIARTDLNAELLTDDIEAFRFDFENESFFPSQTKILRIPIKSPGRCYGVIQWIRLQMDKEIIFENHPSEKSPVSNWQHCAYVFPEPIDVEPGQVVSISAAHNRAVPWFFLDRAESGKA